MKSMRIVCCSPPAAMPIQKNWGWKAVGLGEGMVVASAVFQEGGGKISYDNIPTAVFSHPNVGTVGLTEAEARAKFDEIKIFKSEFKPLKHTLSGSSERALMKIVVDAKSDKVLG